MSKSIVVSPSAPVNVACSTVVPLRLLTNLAIFYFPIYFEVIVVSDNSPDNSVGIAELNVADGTNGQVLQTNGSSVLSFTTVDASTETVGGDLTGTVANAQIIAAAVGTAELANNAITTVKITDANVTADKLATNAVTTVKITDLNVTTAKIAVSAITTAKITTGNITTDLLATDSVTTVKITDLNVTAAKIATNAITTTKITDANVTDAKIVGLTSSKLSGALPALDGSALTNLPYDTAFTAGYDNDMVPEDLVLNGVYGELVMSRSGTFVGEAGYIDTVGTGANVVVDILKNGTTIYSTKPSFSVSTATVTPGVISVTTFASGDRITFKVTQIGSSVAGQGVRFTLKGKV